MYSYIDIFTMAVSFTQQVCVYYLKVSNDYFKNV